ncbi:hypothetical protein ABL78_7858 [Leptomonas seymouri]|uniref:Uncharacterized protein n=1 Tax=Leptomonas seymouri TaxID=5684 RepID=A0A0N0P311_LEPSE|nr:hypothetical protein ABL78_7858 [Leptomonas seymouri]|eukprot:KPI83117.1 hypothetical protein ABL78_7858 [Leptomonas seymouri]
MSSPTRSSAAATLCVMGTLPPSLISAISQTSHCVVAYLSAVLPQDTIAESGASRGSDVMDSTSLNEKGPMRYTVFEDAVAHRRWIVELSSSGPPATPATESWSIDVATSNPPEPSDKTTCATAASMTAAASNFLPPTNASYFMQQDTWRELAIGKASPPLPIASVTAAFPADVKTAVTKVTADALQEGKESADKRVIETMKNAATPSASVTEEGNCSKAAPTTPSVKSTRPSNALLTSVASGISSSLEGLSLDNLISEHGALLRLLVQVLAPQRMAVPLVVRKVCTLPIGDSASFLCEVHDPLSCPSVRRYTEADVVIAVEQLTTPHPRQPKQRELKSEAYLLMNLDGFADGELRHKAVNRAYPALALQWPASAALVDAMERYVDREVVLEVRKRHPELTAQDGSKGQRKRRRSFSSNASSSCSCESSDEEEAPAVTERSVCSNPSGNDSHSPLKRQPPPAAQRVFQSLHEYPRSLERGNLHVWRDGIEAATVRECLQAATTLAPQVPTSGTTGAASSSEVSATTLSVLPIANEEDAALLHRHYDALAAAEEAIEGRLRDYRDTVQELKAWYREEQCSLQFQSQLHTWVQMQEEARTGLVNLYETVHAVRYRLERDLADYLHLHALRVL